MGLDADEVVGLINARHATAWRPASRLAGGHSVGGAHELRDAAGRRAVLKWYDWDLGSERLRETRRLIERAVTAGWRSPLWLAYGRLPQGGSYVVREFVEAEPAAQLGGREIAALIDANRRQAGLVPVTERDWSYHVRSTLYADGGGCAPRMRTHPDTARLLRRIEAATAELRTTVLPTDDLVHGDFTLDNALFRDGSAYLIDAEFAGKGTRAYDLATLLVETRVDDPHRDARTVRRLRDECVGLVGSPGLLLCASTRIVLLAAWGFDHWPADLATFAAQCEELLDSLGEP